MSEQASQVQVMLPPIQYDVRTTKAPNGTQQVMMIFGTIYGTFAFPFDPNTAIDCANKLRKVAKATSTGLTIIGDVGSGDEDNS